MATNQRNPNVIVSVVDGGVDIEHEDFKDNLWVNEGEIPDNGIDDDNNGYIDDVNGYNFVDNKRNYCASRPRNTCGWNHSSEK